MPVEYYNIFSPVGASYLLQQEKRDRQWTTTPNYHSIKKSDLPYNSYRDDRRLGTATRGVLRQTSTSPPYGTSTTYFDWPQNDDSLGGLVSYGSELNRTDESMQNEALTKAIVKIGDAKSNLLMLFAEKKKTSDMIYANARKVYDAYRFFRRGDFKNAAWTLGIETPHKAYKGWLEFQYGWMPILLETKGVAELCAQRYGYERPFRFTESEKVIDTKTKSTSSTGNNRYGFEANLASTSYSTTRRKTCRVVIQGEIHNPLSHTMHQLGISNPALVAWELVPYSFVFDWFIQVGDWLQVQTALDGVTVRKAFVSHLLEVEATASENFGGYSGFYYSYAGYSSKRRVRQRNYRRDPITVIPGELIPVYDESKLHWKRIVSAISLLAVQAGKAYGSSALGSK